jgi:hypothetical protein
MDTSPQFIPSETEALLRQYGGPVSLRGQQGDYVVMRSDIYAAMLGISDDAEAETLASVRRGIADMKAGRTKDLDQAFRDLEARYEE